MSIKSELGEIVHAVINGDRINVDVYDLNVNGQPVDDVSGRIDRDGDLFIEAKLDVGAIKDLWTTNEILSTFTKEELLSYLDLDYLDI